MKRSLREPYTSWSVKQGSENGDAYIYLSTWGGGGGILFSEMGRYTAFQTTRRWSIRRKELTHKVKELKYMKSGGHEAEDQKQI